jgi:hypothetical protein
MNDECKPFTCSGVPPVEDANAICDACGSLGAFAFDGVELCLRCYSEKGACCADSGKDDETTVRQSGEARTTS